MSNIFGDIFDKILTSADKAVDIKSKYESAKNSLKLDQAALDFFNQRTTPTYNTQPGAVPTDPTWYMTQAEPQNMAANAKPQTVYVESGGDAQTLLLLGGAALLVLLLVK